MRKSVNLGELKVGLEGRFKIVAHKVDSEGNIISSRVAADWFKNLITNGGLDKIARTTTEYVIGSCQVGSGSTPPTFTDTALAAKVAETSTFSVNWAAHSQLTTAPRYTYYTVTFRFNTGVAAGNLSEVGTISNDSITANRVLFNRALILDGSGNPTTITVLSDEILDVTYEVRLYLPNGGNDVTGTFNQTIDGVSTVFNYTIRACNIRSTTGAWFGTWLWNSSRVNYIAGATGNANGGGIFNSAMSALTDSAPPTTASAQSFRTQNDWPAPTYTNGTYYYDLTAGVPLVGATFTFNLLWLFIGSDLGFQISLSPSITKDNTKVYQFTVRFSWGRYTP